MKQYYKTKRWSLGRQHLRERLMRECTDRKIEERRQASENMQQEAVPEEVHEEGEKGCNR